MAAVLKTAIPSRVSWVRIPLPPPLPSHSDLLDGKSLSNGPWLSDARSGQFDDSCLKLGCSKFQFDPSISVPKASRKRPCFGHLCTPFEQNRNALAAPISVRHRCTHQVKINVAVPLSKMLNAKRVIGLS